LLTSDSGEKEESLMRDKLEPVEILKVGHHGSKYSSGESFLKTIRPKAAVISVGKNQFGHPTPEVLKRLEAVGAEVLRTDEKGTIQIESDGKSWWLNGVK
jgi:competence protein ComEC